MIVASHRKMLLGIIIVVAAVFTPMFVPSSGRPDPPRPDQPTMRPTTLPTVYQTTNPPTANTTTDTIASMQDPEVPRVERHTHWSVPLSTEGPAPAATMVGQPTGAPDPTTTSSPVVVLQPPAYLPDAGPLVYLTFDVEGRGAPEILAVLRANQIRATMFLVGSWAASHPDLVRQMVADGHAIGNHSATHPFFTRLPPAVARAEIQRAEETIQQIAGVSPRPLFRFPYGAGQNTPWLKQVVADAGYHVLGWTVDPQDWRGGSAASIAQHVVSRTGPGGIVLLHPASPGTPSALQLLINGLRARGFRFAPL